MDHGFLSFVLKRFLQAIPLVFAVIILNFFLIQMAPGDPVELLLRDVSDEKIINNLRAAYGLDQPLYKQLINYLTSVMTGNLGYSIRYNRPVLTLIWEHVPATLLLMTTALGISIFFGIALGILAAIKPFSILDNFVSFISLAGYSLPIFWFGQILVIVFSIKLNLFPSGGMFNIREGYTGLNHALDVAKHLTLPALCFSSYYLALISRITRTSMIEELRREYVTTARSKGLSERIVYLKHMLRNAILPVITIIGMGIGLMFTGSVLTETVFSWPGLGRLTFDSISARDYPVLMGLFIMVSVAVIIGNFIADVLYSVLDPRIRNDR